MPRSVSATPPRAPTPGEGGSVPRFEPDVFGKYFLLQRIAIGGMAEVIRAKTVGAGGFQKELVVKRILPRLARDQAFVRMFVNEAKITVGLSHPNIAQVFELGQIDGSFFMAMELVDGVQLRELIPLFRGEGPLQIDHALWIAFEALRGLDHAHRATDALGVPLDIVHCDLSPDNVMVTFDAGVKVVDFGIARAGTGLSSQPGLVMGKVNFLSPEQATAGALDPRSDLYSMGVVLYHLLTGAYPYGRFERLEELVPLVRGQVRYVSARDHDPRIPPELDAILARAVALRPENRYPDARAFMQALEEMLYPTPHSAIADHLRVEIARSFAGLRDRLARLRANDETVMRILVRRLDPEAARPERPRMEEVHALPRAAGASRGASVTRRARLDGWRLTGRQWAVTAVLAVLLALGGRAVERRLGSGTLLVESTPPGARVVLDANPVPGVTPVVLDGMKRHKAYAVRMELPGHHPWVETVEADGAPLVRIRGKLVPSIAALEVTSTPAGAQVLLDDRWVGVTPVTLEAVDLAVPHKLTLKRNGYELDEAVIRDLQPGAVVHRELTRGR